MWIENVASRALNQARSHNVLEQIVSQSASEYDRSTEKARSHPALTETRHLDSRSTWRQQLTRSLRTSLFDLIKKPRRSIESMNKVIENWTTTLTLDIGDKIGRSGNYGTWLLNGKLGLAGARLTMRISRTTRVRLRSIDQSSPEEVMADYLKLIQEHSVLQI
jgi:hypothetical protein